MCFTHNSSWVIKKQQEEAVQIIYGPYTANFACMHVCNNMVDFGNILKDMQTWHVCCSCNVSQFHALETEEKVFANETPNILHLIKIRATQASDSVNLRNKLPIAEDYVPLQPV